MNVILNMALTILYRKPRMVGDGRARSILDESVISTRTSDAGCPWKYALLLFVPPVMSFGEARHLLLCPCSTGSTQLQHVYVETRQQCL